MQPEDHSTSQCGPLANTKCQKYYIQKQFTWQQITPPLMCGDDEQERAH